MIVDKDKNGNFSITELTSEEVKILTIALDIYFTMNPANCRTDEERRILLMKNRIENLTKQ